jgi:hypothetical protein
MIELLEKIRCIEEYNGCCPLWSIVSPSPLGGGGVSALSPTLKSLRDLDNAANNM